MDRAKCNFQIQYSQWNMHIFVLYFVVIIHNEFLEYLCVLLTHITQGCLGVIAEIIQWPQYQRSNPKGYGLNSTEPTHKTQETMNHVDHNSVVAWMSWHFKSPATPLFNSLLKLIGKKTPKLYITLWGHSTGGLHSQRASNVENVSMSWHHHYFFGMYSICINILKNTLWWNFMMIYVWTIYL